MSISGTSEVELISIERCEVTRQFDHEDIARLRILMEQEMVGKRGGPALLTGMASELEELISLGAPEYSYVGTFDGYMVGYLVSFLVSSSSFDHKVRLLELFVEQDFRAVGIGSSLMDALWNDLELLEVPISLELTVLPGDRAAKSLAEGYGLKARAIVMEARLIS